MPGIGSGRENQKKIADNKRGRHPPEEALSLTSDF